MTIIALPQYHDLDAALTNTALKLHPSQVHGLICGILSGNLESASTWEQLVRGDGEPISAPDILEQLYNVSAQQLKEFLFQLQLVLPSDSEQLTVRAEALTLWCQGFLTGLKLSDIPIENNEVGEVSEAISDLIEIAKMNYEEVVASEEDEHAYVELVEYVRMAAILIYQECREKDGEKKASQARSKKILH